MPNRPARFTTADLRRAAKVAQEFGPEWVVEIGPDGTIRLTRDAPKEPAEPDEGVTLWWTLVTWDQAASGSLQP